jgi:hypothetical protein
MQLIMTNRTNYTIRPIFTKQNTLVCINKLKQAPNTMTNIFFYYTIKSIVVQSVNVNGGARRKPSIHSQSHANTENTLH